MPRVTFVSPRGVSTPLEIPVGTSLMSAAVASNLDGILADCGGACCCATCHVYVAGDPTQCLPPPGPLEAEMLDFVLAERRSGSRLCCQLVATEGCDGLVVQIAELQR